MINTNKTWIEVDIKIRVMSERRIGVQPEEDPYDDKGELKGTPDIYIRNAEQMGCTTPKEAIRKLLEYTQNRQQ